MNVGAYLRIASAPRSRARAARSQISNPAYHVSHSQAFSLKVLDPLTEFLASVYDSFLPDPSLCILHRGTYLFDATRSTSIFEPELRLFSMLSSPGIPTPTVNLCHLKA